MAKRLFGTDGIRGRAGEAPLDPATVTALGTALGDDLKHEELSGSPVLIGMDTRESGPAIAAQLADGLRQAGVQTQFAGVVTTPGVAWLTRRGGYSAGVMISASHNPFYDNGIKIFARSGYKLPDSEEHEIEDEIFRLLPTAKPNVEAEVLQVSCDSRPYIDFLLSTLSKRLNGLRIVLDCGHGAASALAPELFRAAGAEVTALFNDPTGRNINLDCGALHVEHLREQVLALGADAGIAFDGDADRAILISNRGRIVDGDAAMLIAGRLLKSDGLLTGNMVVSTVMSNIGLEKALASQGIAMLRTPVGDKYVLEEMLRQNAALGGEQSGHMIFRDYATTGDGMLTGLRLLEACVRENATLDELASAMVVYPQLLVNIPVKARKPLDELPRVIDAISEGEKALEGIGRVLVRFSGTEPLARVMVEGPDSPTVEFWAHRIADVIRAELA